MAAFRFTQSFPPDQRYRLTDQIQTAAHSVPSNIAEGFGRRQPRDKARFYNIAEGSVEELKDAVIYVHDLGWLPDFDKHWALLEEVSRMLRRLIDVNGNNRSF
jgi:four helix bundle protein